VKRGVVHLVEGADVDALISIPIRLGDGDVGLRILRETGGEFVPAERALGLSDIASPSAVSTAAARATFGHETSLALAV